MKTMQTDRRTDGQTLLMVLDLAVSCDDVEDVGKNVVDIHDDAAEDQAEQHSGGPSAQMSFLALNELET